VYASPELWSPGSPGTVNEPEEDEDKMSVRTATPCDDILLQTSVPDDGPVDVGEVDVLLSTDHSTEIHALL